MKSYKKENHMNIENQQKQNELDKTFLKIAIEFSKHSKCVSKKVCALLVKDNRIISLGLNGTLPGFKNCSDIFDISNFDREEHHKWSLKNELHAEPSAIFYCAKSGISIKNCTLYCTLKPCETCAKDIISCQIKRVVYYKEYDKCGNTDYFFKNANIEIIKIENIE
jgi:dCMP deaminase